MRRQFSGICIGGPLDGHQLTHYAPYYRAMDQQPLTDIFENGNISETVRVFQYEIDEINFGDGRGEPMYLWRLSTDTIRDAVVRVMSNYPRGNLNVLGRVPK